jgi:amino acid transporter
MQGTRRPTPVSGESGKPSRIPASIARLDAVDGGFGLLQVDGESYTCGMTASPPTEPASASQPRQALSLFDTTSIIVGIIIGSAIYEISPVVASSAGGWASGLVERWNGGSDTALDPLVRNAIPGAAIMVVWLLGGIVALLGAMCYAEMATARPQAGGTYVFLSEALGRTVGFAFAWCEFWIVRPGNVGAVAFILARYAIELMPAAVREQHFATLAIAVAAIVALAALNALGLRTGKWTQNVLTAAKVIGLAAIVVTAMTLPSGRQNALEASGGGSLGLALILVMFAYGGWADMSFVAAEVRHPERNIFRALVIGTGAVVLIYVTINLAFLYVLGTGGLAASKAVAAEVMTRRFGDAGSRAISLLVVVSCLGAINGMLFTGARIYYALGTHHPVFRWLGAWNERGDVPLRSLLLQTLVTLGLVMGFGINPASFERLVVYTGPFYWGFIALVGVALIVLRGRGHERGAYRVPFFPLTPLLFTASSGAMVYAAIEYAVSNRSTEAAWFVSIVAIGVVVGLFDWLARRR